MDEDKGLLLTFDNRDCLDSLMIEPTPIDLDIPKNGEFSLRLLQNDGYFVFKFEKGPTRVHLTIYPEGGAEVHLP